MLIRRLRSILLQLQQQGRILHFDQLVHIGQALLHKCHLRLGAIIAVSDRLAHDLFLRCHEVSRKQLNELEVISLDEVQLGGAVTIHHQDSEE